MANLTEEQKSKIDDIAKNETSCSEIARKLCIKYRYVYAYVNRVRIAKKAQIKYAENYAADNRPLKKPRDVSFRNVGGYVDTGKEMPPVRKTELKIIADKDLAELACRQMGLNPPVCSLADRPRNIGTTFRGVTLVNGKWVRDNDVNVTGRDRHRSAGAQL